MTRPSQSIADYMTPNPHHIGADQPLSLAHAMMREHRIRHLPVLHGGKLVGLLSLRDLHLMETLDGVDPDQVLVEEAMSQDVYSVAPDAALRDVVHEMAERKLGSAVILSGNKVAGVFTTIDALNVLEKLLE